MNARRIALPAPAPHRAVGLALAVAAAAAGACSGGGGGSDAVPDTFGEQAARRCTEVLDDRDASISLAGGEAAVELLIAAAGGGGEPPAATVTGWRDALAAHAEALAGDAELLATLDLDDASTEEAGAWRELVEAVEGTAAVADDRAALLAGGDWAAVLDDPPISGEAPVLDPATVTALGAEGRDCEVVVDHPGVADQDRPFTVAAAGACAAAVSAQRAAGAGPGRDTDEVVLGAVAEVAQGRLVVVTDDLVEAVDDGLSLRRAVLDELSSVPTDGLDNEQAETWDAFVDAASQRAAIYEFRAAALDDEDPNAITSAFNPDRGSLDVPGLELLDLHRRECRSVR